MSYKLDKDTLEEAYRLMCTARAMARIYDDNRQICKYVHSTSAGHEAIQLALAFQIIPADYVSLYYRDESVLLGLGFEPYELMLQLLAKAGDPFTGGRSYYGHPAIRREGFPTIPHQSSATGMQVIPATGMAHALSYLQEAKLADWAKEDYNSASGKIDLKPIAICSLGDGSITEGEVAEAFQMAVLKKLPILYLVQDNDWAISASGAEMSAMDAYEYAAGFKGMKRMRADGSDFEDSFRKVAAAMKYVREERGPMLLHAQVPLLGHHTSGVRKEWYRTDDDLAKHAKDDPIPKMRLLLEKSGVPASTITRIENEAQQKAADDFERAAAAPEPHPDELYKYEFAPTPITEETGDRKPEGREPIVMVDAALFAVNEIMRDNPNAILYGQDVGRRLGGVFREAATLAEKYGDARVFNTPITEAYIVGSTVGMSAVGVKPFVEIQFADYAWAGVNQLVVEISKSHYLSCGKFPVSTVIRIPVGAYGGGGPYHSDCIESSFLPIRGIKIAYPSNAADMKGLMKSAWYDPNPVVMFEHKGLYWSKVPGTELAKCPEPSEDYVIPFGKARVFQAADEEKVKAGDSVVVITYGMGVHWAVNAGKEFPGCVEVLDLRTLNPLDEESIYAFRQKTWQGPRGYRGADNEFLRGISGGQDIAGMLAISRCAGRIRGIGECTRRPP